MLENTVTTFTKREYTRCVRRKVQQNVSTRHNARKLPKKTRYIHWHNLINTGSYLIIAYNRAQKTPKKLCLYFPRRPDVNYWKT